MQAQGYSEQRGWLSHGIWHRVFPWELPSIPRGRPLAEFFLPSVNSVTISIDGSSHVNQAWRTDG